MNLLLDTCTFLWVAQGSSELSARAREWFADPANEVFLSVVSVWEIGVKNAAGRMPLPQPPERYVPALRERHGIESLALDEAAVLQVTKLPARHRDPFDRLLYAQARENDCRLLTIDRTLAVFGARVLRPK